MGRKLFVGNLPYQLNETELEELFQQAGQVESVRIMRDMATGRPRGFAFVEMSNDEEAQRAIERLHSSSLGGRTIAVNEARPLPERQAGFGGGRPAGGRPGGGGRPAGGNRSGGGNREPRW